MKKIRFLILSVFFFLCLTATNSHALMNTDPDQDQIIQNLLNDSDAPSGTTQDGDFVVPEPNTDAVPPNHDDPESDEGAMLSAPPEGGGEGEGGLDNPTVTGVPGSSQQPGGSTLAMSTSNVNVDPQSGSASLGVPIEVVPGRGGIQPNISLNYSSAFRSGILGFGWNLDFGSIQRSLKKGVPQYDNADKFVMIQSGSTQELVDLGNDLYAPEIEGAFMKIQHVPSGDYWLVTDKQGIKYYFGQANATRQYDANHPTHIFKWCLDKVEDPNGNFMLLNYVKDEGQVYPDNITYTHHTSNPSQYFAQVTFSYDHNRQDTRVSYITGFKVETAWRLTDIEVKADGQLQRRYELNYGGYSAATQRSVVRSITQYGSDGQTALPSTTFNYVDESNPRNNQFAETSQLRVPLLGGRSGFTRSNGINDNGVRLADANGDGWTDILWAESNTGGSSGGIHRTYLNTTTGFQETSNGELRVPSSATFLEATSDMDNGVRLADVNGDGLVDILWSDGETERGTFINNGTNFVGDSGWLVNLKGSGTKWSGFTQVDGNRDNSVRLADVNGDGLIDLIWAAGNPSNPSSGGVHKTYLNTGNGFQETSKWIVPGECSILEKNSNAPNGVAIIDVNGDGLADIIWADGSNASQHKTYINNGSGFEQTGNWVMNLTPLPNSALSGITRPNGDVDNYVRFADVNGDGLIDFLWAHGDAGNNSSHGHSFTYLNDGRNFVKTNQWGIPVQFTERGSDEDNGVRLADINADGLVDVIWADGRDWNQHRTYLNTGKPFDLLEEVNNGFGVTNEIIYTKSTEYDNTFLPFPVPTVSSVTLTEQFTNNTYTTRYEYQKGLWRVQPYREFRGFGEVKIIDTDGNYSVTKFHQDDIYKGRPESQASYDAQDHLYAKTENTWDHQTIATGVEFPYLKRVDNYVYDGDATGKRTAQEFEYGEATQYGNLTKTIQLGEVDLTNGTDIGTDKRTVETEYHNVETSSLRLLGFPKHVTVKDDQGVVVRQEWLYYDDSTNYQTPPTQGLLTQKESWAGNGPNAVNPKTEYAYDDYGNLEATEDALDHPTSIEYDPTNQEFPLKTKNALDQEVINEYYGINSVPLCEGGHCGLWGQLKSTTDPNNQTRTKIYDVFGRPIKTISPLDSISSPTTEVAYEINGTYTKVTTRQRIENGQPWVIESVQYYDGLGRLIQAKSKSGVEGQYVVSGQTEYNSRGLPEKKYLPYFTTNPMNTMDPINTNTPHTTIEYDAMGRVVKTTNPDDTYATVEYDDWATTTIDENGHKQKSYFDAYGRLVKKEEYEGADGRGAPIYPAQSFSLYATTQYEYDSEGNLTKVIDAHNNITQIFYDELGRKRTMIDPDMGSWTYEYDLNGNLENQTDAKNQQLDFDYDDLNRLENKTDNSAINVDYTYDDQQVNNSIGRLTKAQYSWLDKTDFAYDVLGRETTSTKAIGQHQYTVQREYDALNRLKKIEYPDNEEVYYLYNEAGQIIKIADGNLQYYGMDEPFAHYKMNDVTYGEMIDEGAGNNEAQFYGTTKFLLPLDGDNNATTAIDTASNHSISFHGNAKLTTSVKQFGSASLVLDGNGDYLSSPDSTDWDVAGTGSDNWTIDLWVKMGNPQLDDQIFVHQYEDNRNRWFLGQHYAHGQSYLRFVVISEGSVTIDCGTGYTGAGINDTNWHHVTLVRKGNEYGLYLDGNQVAYDQDSNTDAFGGNLYLGAQFYNNTVSTAMTGQLDEIRITNSNAFSASPNAGKTDIITIPQGPHDLTEPGKIIRAIGLNGADTYASLNDLVDDIKDDGVGAISFWFNADVTSQVLFSIGDGSLSDQLAIGVSASEGLGTALISGGSGRWELHSDNLLSAGNWYHVVLSHDGAEASLYLNGVKQNNWFQNANKTKWIKDVSAGVSYLGCRPDRNMHFKGRIDDFRYYKAPLSETEVQAIYNNGSGTEESRPQISNGGQPITKTYVQDVEYNAAGQIVHIWYGNETHTIYEYDDDTLRLKRIFTQFGTIQTLQDLNYTYDNVGNIVSIVDAVNTASQTFKYDEFNRLVEARGKYGHPQIQTKTYAYDEIGNIIQKDGLTYTYSQQNAGPHAVTSLSDGTQFAYDANGNMTMMDRNGVVTNYYYDSENRLKEVRKDGIIIAKYEYDGDGGRTKKTTWNYSDFPPTSDAFYVPSSTTTYVGSLFEKIGNTQTKYIYLGDTRICRISEDTVGTEVRYYHGDHLGSANVITDADGFKKELIEYEPYGQFSRREMYGQTQAVAWFYFTGKPYDDETGLYYYGARYYNPLIGRFITPDTIVQAPDNPQTLNRYAYCGNNPVLREDPDGHFWFVAALIGSVIGAATSAATGGNIGLGALTGMISGLTFNFVGGLGLTGGMQVFGHAAGGAVSGGINSVISGADPGWGALVGGFSAGAAEWIGGGHGLLSSFEGDGWGAFAGNLMQRSAIGGVIGGATSAMMGGDFVQGLQAGAMTSAIAFATNHGLHDVGSFLHEKVAERIIRWARGATIDSDLKPKHGETFEQYYERHKELFSKQHGISDALGITGLYSLAVSTVSSGAFDLLGRYAQYQKSAMYREILVKNAGVFEYYTGPAAKVTSLSRASSLSRCAGAVSAVVTTGATAYKAGLYINARLNYHLGQ